jgi:hypothetical protein
MKGKMMNYRMGGMMNGMKKGGKVKAKKMDGVAHKGKTKAKMIKMRMGGMCK